MLKLAALHLDQVSSQPAIEEAEVALSHREQDRLHAAREHLLADMSHPPTLSELATKVGMHEKRLNAGFRTLFGMTAFEMLHNERLEHARQVLVTEEVPLKVIAHRVGYRHVTNFIGAFTRRYGVPPKRYLVEAAEVAHDAPSPGQGT